MSDGREASILHVLNGDTTGRIFADSSLPGEAVVWRELYIAGPLAVPSVERAAWLERAYGIPLGEFLSGLERQERALSDALRQGNTIALWIDPDLFDHAIAMRVCHLIDGLEADVLWVELPSGSCDARTLRLAWERRLALDPASVRAAARAWDAYAGGAEKRIAAVIDDCAEALPPGMADALRFHLQRYPGEDGLGAVERFVVRETVERPDGWTLAESFRAVCKWFPLFGSGDLQYFGLVAGLSSCEPPLLKREDDRLLPTAEGREVAEGIRTAPAGALELAGFRSRSDA